MNVLKYRLSFSKLKILIPVFLVFAAWHCAEAADSKPTRFWNLTGTTIVKFELSPTGKENFGADQCQNDKDHAVDDDERLPITNVATGFYDARVTFTGGRVCFANSIAIEEGKIFSIDGKQLTDCHEPK